MNDGVLAAKSTPASGLKLQQKMTHYPASVAGVSVFCLRLKNELAVLYDNIDAGAGGKACLFKPVTAEDKAWMAAVMARPSGFRILMALPDIADLNLSCAFRDVRYCLDM
jgi:hypothetical protein